MSATRAAVHLLKWYSRNGRDLPWRRRVTPYRTWVSEVMLQQTRVETVSPYFRRWMLHLPSLRALAEAPERRVLALWEGLGYYSRARNLHRAARMVVHEKHGRIPSDPAVLRTLPGVGEYTAAAVASIAFDRDVPALDANVRRVLARLACMRLPVMTAAGEDKLRVIALQHLPKGRAGEFNQALMDLGALVCVPHEPRCDVCPLRPICGAHRRGLVDFIPVRPKPRHRPHYYSGAAVIVRGKHVLLLQRARGGLLGGLWEFPKSRRRPRLPSRRQLVRDFDAQQPHVPAMVVGQQQPLTVVEHAYSHFSITVHAFLSTATVEAHNSGIHWVPIRRLAEYPMGKVDRTIARYLALRLRTQAGARRVRSRSLV